MRDALWPGTPSDHEHETRAFFDEPRQDMVTLVAERPGGKLGGFVEASLRNYAEGCVTSPVGYVEGLYVDPDLRGEKLSRALVEAAEAWARAKNCREMASDVLPENHHSYRVHLALGFEDAGQIICLRKSLTDER